MDPLEVEPREIWTLVMDPGGMEPRVKDPRVVEPRVIWTLE
jgi:hypothetical protein